MRTLCFANTDDSLPDKSDLAIGSKHFTITDHNGDEVSIAWNTKNSPNDTLPPFPFQFYIINSTSTEQVALDTNYAGNFAAFVQHFGPVDESCRCHFQVYHRIFPNILACVAHQRQEILHRNRNGITPRMVARWTQTETGYKGHIIVNDTNEVASARFLLVSFDPAEYDNRSQFAYWNAAAYTGDMDIVHAHRCLSIPLLIRTLHGWWHAAGARWTEDDLQRRNEGGASPVLYPAVDPAAHYDAEHEEIQELDGTAIPGSAAQATDDSNDDDGGWPRIIDTFDPSDLRMREQELKDYYTETYSDILGLPVTSTWSGQRSRLRPQFSFTLYLAFDFFDKLQVHSQALFRCLNRGLIAQEEWTLDIVKNMPSLDAAFHYHARATAQRSPERCEQRRKCVRLVVRRVAGVKLPSEIVEHIEELLLPPEIPRYSGRPCRPFQDVFLYLDKSRQYTGPLIIYSNLDKMQSNHEQRAALQKSEGFDRADTEMVLRVVYQRYWHRVADELHVLWSLSSPRSIMTADMTIPRAELKLTTPEVCVWRPLFGLQCINGYLDVEIRLYSTRGIVIPCHRGLFSHDLWSECVDTVDLETGDILAPLPPETQEGPICLNSWDQSRVLGFRAGSDSVLLLDPNKNFACIWANGAGPLALRPTNLWWQHQVRSGKLRGGREYAFRLKPGISISRWTYGTVGKREGPFNLPPIPITVDETLRPFKFRVESVGAPHGSFNR